MLVDVFLSGNANQSSSFLFPCSSSFSIPTLEAVQWMGPENSAKNQKWNVFQPFHLSQHYMHKHITLYVQQMKLLGKNTGLLFCFSCARTSRRDAAVKCLCLSEQLDIALPYDSNCSKSHSCDVTGKYHKWQHRRSSLCSCNPEGTTSTNLQRQILKTDTSPKRIYRLGLCHVIYNEKRCLALLRHSLTTSIYLMLQRGVNTALVPCQHQQIHFELSVYSPYLGSYQGGSPPQLVSLMPSSGADTMH